MSQLDTIPSMNTRKAGKNTEDPIRNLPQFGEKRIKQTFGESNNNRVEIQIDQNLNPLGQDSFDLIREINASNSHLNK